MGLSLPHLILVILIILLLFGAKKVPDIMKDLAKGYKYFRKGLEEEEDEPRYDEKNLLPTRKKTKKHHKKHKKSSKKSNF